MIDTIEINKQLRDEQDSLLNVEDEATSPSPQHHLEKRRILGV